MDVHLVVSKSCKCFQASIFTVCQTFVMFTYNWNCLLNPYSFWLGLLYHSTVLNYIEFEIDILRLSL